MGSKYSTASMIAAALGTFLLGLTIWLGGIALVALTIALVIKAVV